MSQKRQEYLRNQFKPTFPDDFSVPVGHMTPREDVALVWDAAKTIILTHQGRFERCATNFNGYRYELHSNVPYYRAFDKGAREIRNTGRMIASVVDKTWTREPPADPQHPMFGLPSQDEVHNAARENDFIELALKVKRERDLDHQRAQKDIAPPIKWVVNPAHVGGLKDDDVEFKHLLDSVAGIPDFMQDDLMEVDSSKEAESTTAYQGSADRDHFQRGGSVNTMQVCGVEAESSNEAGSMTADHPKSARNIHTQGGGVEARSYVSTGHDRIPTPQHHPLQAPLNGLTLTPTLFSRPALGHVPRASGLAFPSMDASMGQHQPGQPLTDQSRSLQKPSGMMRQWTANPMAVPETPNRGQNVMPRPITNGQAADVRPSPEPAQDVLGGNNLPVGGINAIDGSIACTPSRLNDRDSWAAQTHTSPQPKTTSQESQLMLDRQRTACLPSKPPSPLTPTRTYSPTRPLPSQPEKAVDPSTSWYTNQETYALNTHPQRSPIMNFHSPIWGPQMHLNAPEQSPKLQDSALSRSSTPNHKPAPVQPPQVYSNNVNLSPGISPRFRRQLPQRQVPVDLRGNQEQFPASFPVEQSPKGAFVGANKSTCHDSQIHPSIPPMMSQQSKPRSNPVVSPSVTQASRPTIDATTGLARKRQRLGGGNQG